jgi:transposase-like protein
MFNLRKPYSTGFKLQLAVFNLQGEFTLNEKAAKLGLNVSLGNRWRKPLFQSGPEAVAKEGESPEADPKSRVFEGILFFEKQGASEGA